jgi:hypothetical protein
MGGTILSSVQLRRCLHGSRLQAFAVPSSVLPTSPCRNRGELADSTVSFVGRNEGGGRGEHGWSRDTVDLLLVELAALPGGIVNRSKRWL